MKLPEDINKILLPIPKVRKGTKAKPCSVHPSKKHKKDKHKNKTEEFEIS